MSGPPVWRVFYQSGLRYASVNSRRVQGGGVRLLMDSKCQCYVQIVSVDNQVMTTHFVEPMTFLEANSAAGVAWSSIPYLPDCIVDEESHPRQGTGSTIRISSSTTVECGRVEIVLLVFMTPAEAESFKTVLVNLRCDTQSEDTDSSVSLGGRGHNLGAGGHGLSAVGHDVGIGGHDLGVPEDPDVFLQGLSQSVGSFLGWDNSQPVSQPIVSSYSNNNRGTQSSSTSHTSQQSGVSEMTFMGDSRVAPNRPISVSNNNGASDKSSVNRSNIPAPSLGSLVSGHSGYPTTHRTVTSDQYNPSVNSSRPQASSMRSEMKNSNAQTECPSCDPYASSQSTCPSQGGDMYAFLKDEIIFFSEACLIKIDSRTGTMKCQNVMRGILKIVKRPCNIYFIVLENEFGQILSHNIVTSDTNFQQSCLAQFGVTFNSRVKECGGRYQTDKYLISFKSWTPYDNFKSVAECINNDMMERQPERTEGECCTNFAGNYCQMPQRTVHWPCQTIPFGGVPR